MFCSFIQNSTQLMLKIMRYILKHPDKRSLHIWYSIPFTNRPSTGNYFSCCRRSTPQADANCNKSWSGIAPSQSSGGSIVEEASFKFITSSFFTSMGILKTWDPFSKTISTNWTQCIMMNQVSHHVEIIEIDNKVIHCLQKKQLAVHPAIRSFTSQLREVENHTFFLVLLSRGKAIWINK